MRSSEGKVLYGEVLSRGGGGGDEVKVKHGKVLYGVI